MPLYLIAIVPPGDISETVLGFKRYMYENYGCKVALKSPAHITLIAPFSLSLERSEILKNDLESFSNNHSPFEISLENFNAFAPRVIYVDIPTQETLSFLQKALESFLINKDYSIKKETRPFHPHMTIANRDLKKEDFSKAWNFFKQKSYRASFEVNEICLLEHDGTKWNIIAEARLMQVKDF